MGEIEKKLGLERWIGQSKGEKRENFPVKGMDKAHKETLVKPGIVGLKEECEKGEGISWGW